MDPKESSVSLANLEKNIRVNPSTTEFLRNHEASVLLPIFRREGRGTSPHHVESKCTDLCPGTS